MNSAGVLQRLTLPGLVLLLCLALAFALPRMLSLPGSDEAMFFLHSDLVRRGWLPYRDFFAYLFPGSMWLGGLTLTVLGPTLIGLRLLVWLLLSFSAILLLRMGKQYLKPFFLAALGVFLAVIVIPNAGLFSHHVLSGLLSVWVAFALHRFIQHRKTAWLAVAGGTCALAVLMSQHVGVLLSLAAAAFVLVHLRVSAACGWLALLKTASGAFVLPWVAVLMLAVGLMAAQGIADDWLRDAVFWLLDGHYAKITLYHYFVTGFKEGMSGLLAYVPGQSVNIQWLGLPLALQVWLIGWLPVLGLLWALETLIRLRTQWRTPRYQSLLMLTLLGGAMLFSTLSYSSTLNINAAAWLPYLLAFLAFQRLLDSRAKRVAFAVPAGMLLLFFALLTVQNLQNALSNASWRVTSYGTVEPGYVTFQGARHARLINMMTETIRQNVPPDAPLFAFGISPEFHFLADRPPATRFVWILPVLLRADQLAEIKTALLNNPPPLALYDHKDVELLAHDDRFRAYRHNPPRLTPIWDALSGRYGEFPLGEGYVFYYRLP